MQENIGNLYIVATPIGNLEDITFRAIRILKEVDFVFAEDTRTTGIIFNKYEIGFKNNNDETKLISYNSQNQEKKNSEILMKMLEGKNVALVTDAGTPGISDPGYSAVNFVRKYLLENFAGDIAAQNKIFAIPGASALTAFLSAVGSGTHAFTFYGFLPHKNGRQKAIKTMLANENSSIFYESTHRIEKCLGEIIKLDDGEEKRKVVVGKELTKIFENYLFGTPEEILEIFKNDPQKTKGEFVVMIV
jgi:16S rRNA (cytidine1402-2'-O)-methyltransferase